MFETILTNLFFTAIAYLLVPIIFCISGKPLTLPQIKKIVIINGICVWLVCTIIRIEQGIDGTSAAVILWSYIAYVLMKKKCLKKEEAPERIKIDFETILDNSVSKNPDVKPTPRQKMQPKTVVTVLTTLLVLSVLVNIVQYVDDMKSPDFVVTDNFEKAEFLDEHIVFVIDGYGDYYFTYDEMIEIMKHDDYYEFCAFNEELAIDLGYTAYYK